MSIGLSASAAIAVSDVPAFASAAAVRFRVGVTDWNLKQEGKVESIALAKKLGFDGVQVSIGKGTDKLPHLRPQLAENVLRRVETGGPEDIVTMPQRAPSELSEVGPLGQRWVADSVPIAVAMGVRVVLLPFFGPGALNNVAEMDTVADTLREVAPAAEKAGVILGLEDTISARYNVRIMDRTRSPAVLTYYDVGNSTNGGFNVVDEIRWLGAARICEVHLKDNPHYLGEGTIDFRAVIDALADIGFDKWAQLETVCPTSVEADMRRNLMFIRGLIAARNTA